MIKIKHLIFASTLLLFINCAEKQKGKIVDVPKEVSVEGIGEWIYLFDGTNADGWRSFNGDSLPDGWIVENETFSKLSS